VQLHGVGHAAGPHSEVLMLLAVPLLLQQLPCCQLLLHTPLPLPPDMAPAHNYGIALHVQCSTVSMFRSGGQHQHRTEVQPLAHTVMGQQHNPVCVMVRKAADMLFHNPKRHKELDRGTEQQ
jgi:hypothetical protein